MNHNKLNIISIFVVYLENPLCISSDGSMERRAAHVILDISIGARLQQALGRVRAGVAGSQVQGGLARPVRLIVQVGAVVDEVRDDISGRIFFCLAVFILNTAAAARRNHQWSETVYERDQRVLNENSSVYVSNMMLKVQALTRPADVDVHAVVLDLSLRWRRCHRVQTQVSGVQVLLRPLAVIQLTGHVQNGLLLKLHTNTQLHIHPGLRSKTLDITLHRVF